MYVSILSGQVVKDNWVRLEEAYAKAIRHPPEGLLESFLIQDSESRTLWQIVSVWRSQEAYELGHEMKVTDTCTQLFCDAGSTPVRTAHRVSRHYSRV
ncbi:hypothetical protein [Levilinea saccharolytica]|uniref:ABM domain-containing protein n=1 Tax=Levilinea saccharolytica TaxID=229921 RepID=A0A0P6XSF0_9CHLR|nr:hypothetical protein [Levilinea saccharolytica]KPL75585.1 hypothetical protein ADN01_17170 [Levilinea saccharolytica]GAP17058.1 antibiotic biosynthesis monooxygenase [Levilinea saccharolytica]